MVCDNRVLLMQKSGTMHWELPGGHANTGERMKPAACREVKEETGIKLDPLKLAPVQSTTESGAKTNWYMYTDNDMHKVKLSDEHVNFAWVSRKKLDKYKLSKSTNHLAILSGYNG